MYVCMYACVYTYNASYISNTFYLRGVEKENGIIYFPYIHTETELGYSEFKHLYSI